MINNLDYKTYKFKNLESFMKIYEENFLFELAENTEGDDNIKYMNLSLLQIDEIRKPLQMEWIKLVAKIKRTP